MSVKVHDDLAESIREVGAIRRGEVRPARVFRLQDASLQRSNPTKIFAICIQTDDPELLIPQKIYQVTGLSNGRVKVTDEAGEAAIYPASNFILMDFPPDVQKALMQAGKS